MMFIIMQERAAAVLWSIGSGNDALGALVAGTSGVMPALVALLGPGNAPEVQQQAARTLSCIPQAPAVYNQLDAVRAPGALSLSPKTGCLT